MPNVTLPRGYRLEWGGEFGALQEAKARLAFIVPLSLLLIFMLLYALFNSIRDSLLALAGIPFAAAGGILGLWVSGLNLSVSAAIGFISLFGVATMDGILLVSNVRRNLLDGLSVEEAALSAGSTRMRQVFMTALSAYLGLVPAAMSRGIGTQVQQPARDRGSRRNAALAYMQPAYDPDARAHFHATYSAHRAVSAGADQRALMVPCGVAA